MYLNVKGEIEGAENGKVKSKLEEKLEGMEFCVCHACHVSDLGGSYSV